MPQDTPARRGNDVTTLETTFYVDGGDGPSPVTVALEGPEREEANQHACTFTVTEGGGMGPTVGRR